MAELRPAIAAVGEPVAPPSAEVRARHIAAALAAASDPVASTPGREVRPIGRRRVRTIAPWAAAAAAVVAVVVALAALAGQSGTRSADTASKNETATGAAVSEPSSTTVPVSPQSSGYASARGLDALIDLGSVSTAGELDARARGAIPASTESIGSGANLGRTGSRSVSASTSTTSPAVGTATLSVPLGRCVAAPGALSTPLGPVVLQARATVAGHPAGVLVYRASAADDGRLHLVAFDAATCRVLVDRPL